jgi:hypothetical protein
VIRPGEMVLQNNVVIHRGWGGLVQGAGGGARRGRRGAIREASPPPRSCAGEWATGAANEGTVLIVSHNWGRGRIRSPSLRWHGTDDAPHAPLRLSLRAPPADLALPVAGS